MAGEILVLGARQLPRRRVSLRMLFLYTPNAIYTTPGGIIVAPTSRQKLTLEAPEVELLSLLSESELQQLDAGTLAYRIESRSIPDTLTPAQVRDRAIARHAKLKAEQLDAWDREFSSVGKRFDEGA